MARVSFDEQLAKLNLEMIKMGALCEDAITSAINSLMSGDVSHIDRVYETDARIDQKERDIEAICMRLLLQQQPVARDLRTISSALKMISDMERIGDQASDIAQITQYVKSDPTQSKTKLYEMSSATIKMVTKSVDSFVKKDMDIAQSVMRDDDVVDGYFSEVKKELIDIIAQMPANGEVCLDLLMIAKYLERIGDHAVNIAEWVVYSITGKHVDADDV